MRPFLAMMLVLAACSSDPATEASGGAPGGAGGGDSAGAGGGSAGSGSSAGTGASSGTGGASAGQGGAAGASSGTAGAAGGEAAGAGGSAGSGGAAAGAGGSGPALCTPGQQLECACPGSAVKGAQKCKADGSGFANCEGCLGGAGGAAGALGASGGAGQGGAGQGGAGAGGQSGAAGAPCVLVPPPAKWCGQCKNTCGATVKCPLEPAFCDEKEVCASEGGGVGYCVPKCTRAEKGDAKCAMNLAKQPYGYDCYIDGTELGCEPPGLSSTYCCSFPTY